MTGRPYSGGISGLRGAVRVGATAATAAAANSGGVHVTAEDAPFTISTTVGQCTGLTPD
jgi:hypothetical protein